jgi:ketosteroid isomerase-like protein
MSDLDATPDSRLALAIDLLRSVVGAGEAPAGGAAGRGFAPLVAQPELDRRLSATDLISFWFQPAATAFDPWDEFFSAPAPKGRNGVAAPDAAEGALADLRAMVADPEGELADEQADAAVECLYEFVHAVGRRDVDRALELVADDYHTLEDDREVDRLGLRQQLESLLGGFDGWQVDTSLVTIPEVIPHPGGVAILAEIQVDGYRPDDDDAWRSIIQRRVAVLERVPDGEWLITALSRV